MGWNIICTHSYILDIFSVNFVVYIATIYKIYHKQCCYNLSLSTCSWLDHPISGQIKELYSLLL